MALGLELDAPFNLTWSCYSGEEEACGECDSCVLRLRAFDEVGTPDPIPYAARKTTPVRRQQTMTREKHA